MVWQRGRARRAGIRWLTFARSFTHMTMLPIVERELRVASRKRTMSRVRLAATVVCVVAAILSLAMSGNRGGGTLFLFLTGYAFVFVLVAGVLVTADCLSEERRTGTLGFLFLTDLSGYDVVLGKFAARALQPFYAMFAIVPVMAVSLVMGGVTGGEFWRVAVALLNTLFLSLSVGMCVSAWSKEAQRAVAGTLALMLAILSTHGAVLLAGTVKSLVPWQPLAWLSPAFTFQSAFEATYAARPSVFWYSLFLTNGLGWLLLAIASGKTQSAWKDKPPGSKQKETVVRSNHPAGVLPGNQPLVWLLRSSPGLRFLCWSIAGLWAIGATVAINLSVASGRDSYWSATFAASKIVAFGLKAIFVMVACRFFSDARRSGLLEVLMCAPLTDSEIVRSQWRSLWRLFAGPLVLFCVPLCLRSLLGWDVLGRSVEMTSVLTGYGCGALLAANTLTDFLALGWVGMWYAASMKSPALAPGLAMLLVLLLPSILFCVPAIVVNVFFVVWARERLLSGFRRSISEQFSGIPATA